MQNLHHFISLSSIHLPRNSSPDPTNMLVMIFSARIFLVIGTLLYIHKVISNWFQRIGLSDLKFQFIVPISCYVCVA